MGLFLRASKKFFPRELSARNRRSQSQGSNRSEFIGGTGHSKVKLPLKCPNQSTAERFWPKKVWFQTAPLQHQLQEAIKSNSSESRQKAVEFCNFSFSTMTSADCNLRWFCNKTSYPVHRGTSAVEMSVLLVTKRHSPRLGSKHSPRFSA